MDDRIDFYRKHLAALIDDDARCNAPGAGRRISGGVLEGHHRLPRTRHRRGDLSFQTLECRKQKSIGTGRRYGA